MKQGDRISSLPPNELRKLYTPPIKGVIFPSKNPFYNGKIVDYWDQYKESQLRTNLETTVSTNKNFLHQRVGKNIPSVLNASSKDKKLEKMIKKRVSYLSYAKGNIVDPMNIKNHHTTMKNWNVEKISNYPYKDIQSPFK